MNVSQGNRTIDQHGYARDKLREKGPIIWFRLDMLIQLVSAIT